MQLRCFNQVPVVVIYVTFRHETGIDGLRAGEATGSPPSGETPTEQRLYPVWYMSHCVTKQEFACCVQLHLMRPGPLHQVRHLQGIACILCGICHIPSRTRFRTAQWGIGICPTCVPSLWFQGAKAVKQNIGSHSPCIQRWYT